MVNQNPHTGLHNKVGGGRRRRRRKRRRRRRRKRCAAVCPTHLYLELEFLA